jgi:Capsular polysaccharide synthesis protein/Polysaccharide pyruvyl transferase/Methyltransferase domain
MPKIIWTCWFQGRLEAPELVRKCLQSWETRNPGWDFRCLDAGTIARYIDLGAYVDLTRQTITAASLSDILRVLLLHEYGGVWVDATTFCNTPLDDWLLHAASTGFFAFSRPGEDRLLATWFLAAAPGNPLVSRWAARAIRYWRARQRSDDYFWFHHLFGELCATDKQALRAWQNVPRISADGPHSIQIAGMYEDFDAVRSRIDWTVPVFKLTHRLDRARVRSNCLVSRVLGLSEDAAAPAPIAEQEPQVPARPIGLLKVGTENLGDHIQIFAGADLLRRAGYVPSFLVDRDDEIAHAPPVANEIAPGILLNGWFKTNPSEWPPHPAYRPLYLGFHIRLFQAPSLISPLALEHYAAHGPIGCRDRYTLSLLRSHGVEAFLSHCLSVTLPRRLPDPDTQTELFVVSRDRQILDFLPSSIGPYTFLSHYSGSTDFAQNLGRAIELLKTYRDRARLVVTTMLHCALPAIAMGIPVVVFYPPNEGAQRDSDLERFSSLAELVRIFRPSEAALVDWQGYTPDVSALKLKIIDTFFTLAMRWRPLPGVRVAGIAPSSALPVPTSSDMHQYFEDPERLARLARTRSPDRQKWGAPSSYKPDWAERGQLAARFIRDGSKVLEIGTGTGTLRSLIAHRCRYTGADLEPLDDKTLALDLDNDPVPPGSWDTVVLLGVLEYLHYPAEALGKVTSAASHIVMSYCCCLGRELGGIEERRRRGWINDMTEHTLRKELETLGFRMAGKELFNSTRSFEQVVFEFRK